MEFESRILLDEICIEDCPERDLNRGLGWKGFKSRIVLKRFKSRILLNGI